MHVKGSSCPGAGGTAAVHLVGSGPKSMYQAGPHQGVCYSTVTVWHGPAEAGDSGQLQRKLQYLIFTSSELRNQTRQVLGRCTPVGPEPPSVGCQLWLTRCPLTWQLLRSFGPCKHYIILLFVLFLGDVPEPVVVDLNFRSLKYCLEPEGF